MIITFTLSLVKFSTFLINTLLNFSFAGEYENLKPLVKNEFTISDTLTFPDLIKNASNSNKYEDVSYDVESFFTSIPVEETINYIVDRTYVRKEIEPLCKKLIFKKLLFKLTKGCVFSVSGKLLKQVDGCPLGGPLSVVLSDIFMCKMEYDVVVPAKPIFYKRYADDTYVRRKNNDVEKLFEELNSYNEDIKLTLEVNPTKFLDTELVRENGEVTTQVFSKSTKLLVHWSSKIPFRHKRNAINGKLHRAKRIVSDFNKELKRIRQKYRNAGFPLKFINETICNFERGKEEMIIPE